MDGRFMIVLVLTVAIAAVAVSMIVGVIWTGRTLGAEAVNAVSMFFGAIVGIIAGYVGGKFEDRKPLPPPVDKWPPDKPP